MQKRNLREKLGKENLDYKSQPWKKSTVNGEQESQSQRSTVNKKVKVNGQLPVMTSAIWRNLMT